eukprot:TRINITY_DN5331_c0_g3_i2.p2 TRINITY_DN5331_c0_g3~~TRINITY_DN5331_c0_g3_i2.p2  ORF type:complete len:245 (+),score=41.35 TRINITY_DN5331_c0_g3_i2:37-771(+)
MMHLSRSFGGVSVRSFGRAPRWSALQAASGAVNVKANVNHLANRMPMQTNYPRYMSSRKQTDKLLYDFLREEAANCKENPTERSEALVNFLNDGWKMETKPGKVLFRRRLGIENIEVEIVSEALVPPPPPEDEEPPEGLENQYDGFKIHISKDGLSNSVRFECYAHRGVLEVVDISILNHMKDVVQRVRVDEIEERGQERVFDYLEERGFNNDFTFVVNDALRNFQDQEYEQWLSSMAHFLSAE